MGGQVTRDAFWKLCREVKADERTIVEGYLGPGFRRPSSWWSYIILCPLGGDEHTFVRRYRNPSKARFDREVAKYQRWLVTYVEQSS